MTACKQIGQQTQLHNNTAPVTTRSTTKYRKITPPKGNECELIWLHKVLVKPTNTSRWQPAKCLLSTDRSRLGQTSTTKTDNDGAAKANLRLIKETLSATWHQSNNAWGLFSPRRNTANIQPQSSAVTRKHSRAECAMFTEAIIAAENDAEKRRDKNNNNNKNKTPHTATAVHLPSDVRFPEIPLRDRSLSKKTNKNRTKQNQNQANNPKCSTTLKGSKGAKWLIK